MAYLIRATGVTERVAPDKGKKFSLEQLQELVGGYIEAVPVGLGEYVICDEEGKLKGKPYNHVATMMTRRMFDPFVGDVLICKKNEF